MKVLLMCAIVACCSISSSFAQDTPMMKTSKGYVPLRDFDLAAAKANCLTALCRAQMQALLDARKNTRDFCVQPKDVDLEYLCRQALSLLDIDANAETDFGVSAPPKP